MCILVPLWIFVCESMPTIHNLFLLRTLLFSREPSECVEVCMKACVLLTVCRRVCTRVPSLQVSVCGWVGELVCSWPMPVPDCLRVMMSLL